MSENESQDFLAEKYSPVFYRIFSWYVLFLFRRRFQCVWVDKSNYLSTGTSTLFIGNHNLWWDGLIPLLLNETIFHHRGRAMMDEVQLRKHPFFRYLGTFSINRQHPRKARQSLEHAAGLINNAKVNDPVGLWLYPEGKLVSPETPITLESGLIWLARSIDNKKAEIVPFATHIHCMRSDKPELFIKFGNPVASATYLSGNMLALTTRMLEDLRYQCRIRSGQLDPHTGAPEGNFKLLLGKVPDYQVQR